MTTKTTYGIFVMLDSQTCIACGHDIVSLEPMAGFGENEFICYRCSVAGEAYFRAMLAERIEFLEYDIKQLRTYAAARWDLPTADDFAQIDVQAAREERLEARRRFLLGQHQLPASIN